MSRISVDESTGEAALTKSASHHRPKCLGEIDQLSMESIAFAGSPLGLRAPRKQLLSTSTRPSYWHPRMTFDGVITKLRNRAQEDIAILQNINDGASRVALGAAAAAMLSVATLPALADIPTAAPGIGLFDDAGIVQKGSAQLFTKASTNIKAKNGYTVRFVMVKSLPYNDTPDDFAKELAQDWSLGGNDVLFVASPKLARAGVFVGEKAEERLTKDIAESIANETYAVAAGEEKYGSAVLDISNRLIPVLAGDADPGPPVVEIREVVQTYKTKAETSNDRTKYIVVVGVILAISFLAPLLQTYWYVKDD